MNKPGRPISLADKPYAEISESRATEDWAFEASMLLKRTMRDRGWGYQNLAEALRTLGIKKSAAAINRRINRGNFSAGFLLACFEVMQVGFEVQPQTIIPRQQALDGLL